MPLLTCACVRVRECVLRLLSVSHCAVDTGSDKDQKSVRWQLVVVPQEGSRLPPPPASSPETRRLPRPGEYLSNYAANTGAALGAAAHWLRR